MISLKKGTCDFKNLKQYILGSIFYFSGESRIKENPFARDLLILEIVVLVAVLPVTGHMILGEFLNRAASSL